MVKHPSSALQLLFLCIAVVACAIVKPSIKYVDLTYAFNNDTMVWPGRNISFHTEFEGYTSRGFWAASKGFCTSEHTSTHIDAPYHFNRNGRRLHEIPFEDLIDIPGVLIDIYDKVHKYKNGKLAVVQNYALTREDVLEWEAKHGKIPQGAVVLIRTGWASRWGDLQAYSGIRDGVNNTDPVMPTHLNFPGFDVSSARYLAVERQVRGVGTDTLAIDPGNTREYWAHRLFASRNVYMLEMIANVHLLPPKGFTLMMVPFKIDFGTGSPTRVLAKMDPKLYESNLQRKSNEVESTNREL